MTEQEDRRHALLLFVLDKVLIAVAGLMAVLGLQLVLDQHRKTDDVLKALVVPSKQTEQLESAANSVAESLRSHAPTGYAQDAPAREAVRKSCAEIQTLVGSIQQRLSQTPTQQKSAEALLQATKGIPEQILRPGALEPQEYEQLADDVIAAQQTYATHTNKRIADVLGGRSPALDRFLWATGITAALTLLVAIALFGYLWRTA